MPERLHASTQALIELCLAEGLTPIAVSASALCIVRAACPLAGIPPARALGIATRVDEDGRMTADVLPPVTYAEGKLAALAKAGHGRPVLACGDSITGDLAMLSVARVPVVVAKAEGSPLATLAQERGWTVLLGE